MGDTYAGVDGELAAFLTGQHVFFVATAPLAADGHVNLSPKGLDTFRIVDRQTVAYLDLTGSGAETIAHLRENGRIALMWCAFEGPPKIVRVHGRGTVVYPGDPEFDRLALHLPNVAGARSIIRVDADRVSDSCGFSVPLYTFEGQRDQLVKWAERKGADGLVAYREERNAESIDGLPAFPSSTDER
jgi:pyridoxamine 5'-phosphate oxidase-like protein